MSFQGYQVRDTFNSLSNFLHFRESALDVNCTEIAKDLFRDGYKSLVRNPVSRVNKTLNTFSQFGIATMNPELVG